MFDAVGAARRIEERLNRRIDNSRRKKPVVKFNVDTEVQQRQQPLLAATMAVAFEALKERKEREESTPWQS